MQIKSILATGEPVFLDRRKYLFQSFTKHFDQLNFLPRQDEWYEAKLPRLVLKGLLTLRTGSLSKANAVFQKNHYAFLAKSRRTEQQINQLDVQPDLIFHIFGTYSPFWEEFKLPYVMYLDYVVALAERNWPSWALFLDERSRDAWFHCERTVYRNATHIFCMSQTVKNSLIQDYGVASDRVTVVGSSGNYSQPFSGKKTFGSRQILFNGSDFERKGGDLVLPAFRQVRKAIPDARLVVIGKTLNTREVGIENPGHVSSKDIPDLFLKSDLVVAPAHCDPFPRFVMEAMNYGVPCVVNNKDGMPEIVDHGVNGIVLDQPNSDELARVMIDLLNDPDRLASLSQGAREKVRTHLNWNAVGDRILTVLSDPNFLQQDGLKQPALATPGAES